MNRQTQSKSNQLLETGGGKTKSNAIEVPSISLPKGGGAIKGIDEKFSVNAVNGTASFSIPLPFSTARGVTPSLSLSYNSGAGNGIFGLGWNLTLASIKRKTDQRLPQYLDSIASDTFLFSEAEDLVPAFRKRDDGSFELDGNNEYIVHEQESADGSFMIRFYRPRIEGLFARIERWAAIEGPEIKWKVTSKDNITTLFGWTENARITKPGDAAKIFEWLPEFVFDDKGNCAHYNYKQEDAAGFDTGLAHNRNRFKKGAIIYTNTYLATILYGNKTPYKHFGDAFPQTADYLFSTIFDYGAYNPDAPFNKIKDWDFRPDAFSNYKAGFEIRTTRLCKRVLFFHHFTGDQEYEGLVRSVNFDYDIKVEEDFTFLKAIRNCGYIKGAGGSYSQQQLPPIEFSYQVHDWNMDVRSIAVDILVHLPAGLNEPSYQFTDLYNEGLAGILTEQANGWYYKQNLGNGKFEQARLITPKPSFAGLGKVMQLSDLDADGGKQLVSFNNEPSGYFDLDDKNEWQSFRSFKSLPTIDFNDPNTRMLDLDGDGRPEIVLSEENVLTWYPSEGKNGFSPAQKAARPFDEEAGTPVVFADQEQSVFLADMSGDGMTDIVRIRNGEVCYWPNLGYGQFGAKVALDNAPFFDHPDAFNPAFLRLADIDGSGTTDIIYLGNNKCSCWKNLCGNRFSTTPVEIISFPEIHTQTSVTVTDLLGNGVACIVWSSPLLKDAHAPLRYIDLMNGKKPHVMVAYKNNLGKEVSLEYSPSTKFYLEDQLAGSPWITRLPFPVHCVSKTITTDKVSGSRFVSEYKYHHGYYDHVEREFRGFGMVAQTDAETFEDWKKSDAVHLVEAFLQQEPVVSKRWYHTGAFLGRDKILSSFENDYWYAEMQRRGFSVTHQEVSLPDARLVAAPGISLSILESMSASDWQEALRACKGTALRSEVFAKDAGRAGNALAAIRIELTPFAVESHNCMIELLQPRGQNKHAVFAVKESETITYNYERNPEDPRIAHKLNIRLDEYGNVLEAASVVYPRSITDTSLPAETRDEQAKTLITYTTNQFTNDVITDNAYRLRLSSEVKTFELRGVNRLQAFYSPADFEDILNDARSDIALYHEIDKPLTSGKARRRLIGQVVFTYYNNDLTAALNLHQLQSLGLPFEGYQLAYTDELVTDIFGDRVDAALLEIDGRFVNREDKHHWWIRSGKKQYLQDAETAATAQDRFYVPISYTDACGATTNVTYDAYRLFMKQMEDPAGNKSGVTVFNFRTLQPQQMKDINGNFSEAISDELGMLKAVAVMGKGNEADELNGLSEVTDAAETIAIQQFFAAADPAALIVTGHTLLQHATTRFVYDLNAYQRDGHPAVVSSISRETHVRKTDGSLNPQSKVQIAFEYTDGDGKVIMSKVQAEPGKAKQLVWQPDNSVLIQEVNTAADGAGHIRWLGTGRTVNNNKGNPVKQYEPYFSSTHHYEDHKELVAAGVTPFLYYDAIGRHIKTMQPDGTFSEVVFDSWKQAQYDANDTVLRSEWYHNRSNRLIDALLTSEGKDPELEQKTAAKAAKHADTPNTLHLDTLGRPVLSIEHLRDPGTDADVFYKTIIKTDLEGNLRSVTDARNNLVIRYKYDMLGNKAYQQSMDAGQRWLLMNGAGNPVRTWDERGHELQYTYDKLQRPLESRVLVVDGDQPLNHIFSRTIYGESLLTADRSNETTIQADNVLGQPIQLYDTAGLVATPAYDLKGQPLLTTRKLFKKYKEVANWTDANIAADIAPEPFTFITETDALGRIIRQVAPDKSIITPYYNEAGLPERESIQHFNADTNIQDQERMYIKDTDYNEKGQREKIIYGNDVTTKYYYDSLTFRLKRLESRKKNHEVLQDLYYTYDPAGNVTYIRDEVAVATFYNNMIVEPVSDYTYDALYRLVSAVGRENEAALSMNDCDNWNDSPFMPALAPGTARRYTQTYQYDAAGNIARMQHVAAGGNWTRTYDYEASNNRLKGTRTGNGAITAVYTKYKHQEQHGYLQELPHLDTIGWNFKEEVVLTIRQRCTTGNVPVITYYQYDGQGQRVRKISENQAAAGMPAAIKEERIYMSGYELYKKHSGANAGLQRESLSLIDKGHRLVMIETRNDIDDHTEKQLVRYQLHNHLGSSALELDEVAGVISYEEYHPFGTTAYQARSPAIRSAAKRYRYSGMERDEETGLAYHGARYYIPWLGRWLSTDPIGIADGINLYRYSGNNPVTYRDPDGKQAKPAKPVAAKPAKSAAVKPAVPVAPKPVPLVTFMDSKVVGIGAKKWLDRFKYDYVTSTAEGGGSWIYDQARSKMGATAFGAAVVLAFAAEEGGWGKGNDQQNTHNPFSLLSKNATSNVGTAHGNVITYDTWTDGFDTYKSLIDKKYGTFNDLLKKDTITQNEINKALRSGKFHKVGGYTNSDKGTAIIGVLKYVLIFKIDDIGKQLDVINKDLARLNDLRLKGDPQKPDAKLDAQIAGQTALKTQLEADRTELTTSYQQLYK